jgi:hypothetical protein
MGPKTGLDINDGEKIPISAGNSTPVFQSVVSYCTELKSKDKVSLCFD